MSPNLDNVVFKVFWGDGDGGPVHLHLVLAVAYRVVELSVWRYWSGQDVQARN